MVYERKRYAREFKLEAVRLVKERGVSVAQASRDLGVHANVLREWMLKPSEKVPLTALLIIELLEKAGLPKGVLNVVHGGRECVDALAHASESEGDFVCRLLAGRETHL